MAEMDTLLTTRQLQDLLQVDRITIYRMLNDGRLQGFKVGGQWRFSRQAIEQWLQEQQASLEVSESPKLTEQLGPSPEALPLSCIRAIQDIFAEALGVGTVTTAVDGNPITPISNSCEFCTLILGTRVGQQRCTGSWRAAAAARGKTPLLATCHAGLCYVWGRIEVQGQFVAATHAGQFLDRPPAREKWSVAIRELSAATGLDEGKLQQALASVPVLDADRQQQIPRLLHRVAETFSEIGEERLNLLSRLQRIAEISSV
jgi:excisionase family DNA binding protein